MPDAAIVSTLAGVRHAGLSGKESGALWLGSRQEVAEVTTVALPVGDGHDEARSQWSVSAQAYGTLSRWAKPQGLSLLGVLHLHLPGIAPRMSQTDRNHGVRAPAVLSIIIGNGGADEEPERWGWFVFEEHDFRQFSPGELGRRVKRTRDRRIETVLFNRKEVLRR